MISNQSRVRQTFDQDRQKGGPPTVERRPRPLATSSALLALCLLMPTVAAAQGNPDKAAAEALFEQARKLMDQGKYATACEKFEASQELDAGLGTLLHLGDCYEKAHLLASAWGTFEEAASLAQNRGDNERAQIAAVRAAALKPQLIRLVIRVARDRPPGLEVRRNGRIVPEATYDAAVPVDQGTWKISASAPGYEPFEVSIEARSGSSEPYIINIPALTMRAPPAPLPVSTQAKTSPTSAQASTDAFNAARPPQVEGNGQRTLGVIIGGAGLVSAVVSGVFSMLAAGNNSESLDHCVARDGAGSNQCSAEGKRLRDDALNQAGIATVSGIIGVVAIGGGATLYITAPREQERPGTGFVTGLKGAW